MNLGRWAKISLPTPELARIRRHVDAHDHDSRALVRDELTEAQKAIDEQKKLFHTQMVKIREEADREIGKINDQFKISEETGMASK